MLPRTNSNVAWILGAFVVGLLVFGNEDTYGQDAEPRGSESLRSSDPVSIESFESRIRPLLVERCFECHSEGSDASGGLVLDSLEGMLRGGDSGPAINLDQPEESLVLRAIRYRDPKLQMPPDSKLSDAQVEQLREWIVSGAPVPTTFAKGADHPTVSTALTVDRAREHWAYRPIERPDIPDVSRVGPEEDRPESPIDAFLVRVQQRMDVSPSDRVDLGTWLRRLTIDLHGLNPTVEDLRYWLDLETTRDGPERMMLREQVVDSMLASPRYGERMARRWMDGVRYAESLT
ncbi:MAG: DUF1549 domain-containing protein, partial [Planctomycetota bacterium]